ncbi:uncharacterized protein LOC131235202 [Magnolia sinica]|uniref:uncharacterized protein LOC131235202 n=1 Tax=Magnolia sinica TaxID=86752 RepID=UPI00265B6B9A|nr:uncharacterized protein LOC131235202 [Magnolia sinica]
MTQTGLHIWIGHIASWTVASILLFIGIQGKTSTQASGSPSITLFKWYKDSSGALDVGGSKSPSMQVMQVEYNDSQNASKQDSLLSSIEVAEQQILLFSTSQSTESALAKYT